MELPEYLNLERLVYFIQKGVLNPKEPITMKILFESGVLTKIKHGVKLLGRGAEELKALSASLGTPI